MRRKSAQGRCDTDNRHLVQEELRLDAELFLLPQLAPEAM